MIIWLASYPKSGNTFLRSLLSAFFFSKEGNFNFDLLKKIKKFPSNDVFKKIGVDINDTYKVAKNYIKAQEEINRGKTLQFWKTHCSFCKMYNNFNFSNIKNTLGVIYIVRDPRNVLTSFSHHNSKTIEETLELLINDRTIGNEKDEVEVYVGSWSFNYNSWKIFKPSNKYLLVKYEDLIHDTKNSLTKILNFIKKLSSSKFLINENKISKVIDTTSFARMKSLEEKYGFEEAEINEKTGKKVRFFNLGLKNNWENNLDLKIKKKIEIKLEKEMIELGYL